MFCPYCGTQNAEYSKFCAGCGAKIGAEQPVMEQPQPVFEPAPAYEAQTVCEPQPACDAQPVCDEQPVYQQNAYQRPAQPTYYQQPMNPQTVYPAYQQPAPLPGNGLGIAGMVLGIISLVCCCVWYIAGICAVVGLILSIVSMVQGRKVGKTNGFALAGIICCSIGLVFAVIMLLSFISSYDSFLTEMEMYTKEY